MSANHPRRLLLQNTLWAPWLYLTVLFRKIPWLPEGGLLLRSGGKHWKKRFESNAGFEDWEGWALGPSALSHGGWKTGSRSGTEGASCPWAPGTVGTLRVVVCGSQKREHQGLWPWEPTFRAFDQTPSWEKRAFCLTKLWWLVGNFGGRWWKQASPSSQTPYRVPPALTCNTHKDGSHWPRDSNINSSGGQKSDCPFWNL